MNTTPQRAFTRLPSGAHLNLLNPDPHAWTHNDLATRLARTNRWSGESAWEHPLSVAQHSLTVLHIRQLMCGYTLTATEALRELLHDAEEGFLGFDCISPLKQVLNPSFNKVSEKIMQAIETRYQLPAWTEKEYALHKQADLTAAASEAVHCVGWSRNEVREILQISHTILDIDPLVREYGDLPWEPWPADLAAKRFLTKLHKLMGISPAHRRTTALQIQF